MPSARREREGGGVLFARTPGRAHLEQLDPGGAEEQHLRVGEVLRELFEQVEERARRPVDILDGQDRQLLATERRDIASPSFLQPPADFVWVAARCGHAREREPDRPRRRLEHSLGLVLGDDRLDRGSQLREGDLCWIGVEDAGVSFRRLRERPEGDPLAIREAAALYQARIGKPLDELREQARLADPCGTEERDELRRALALDPRGHGAQDCELVVSPDQRRAQAGDAPRRRFLVTSNGNGHPGGDRLALPLRLESLVLAVRDRAACRRLRPLPDEHLSRLGVLLQPCGHVDGVAADHQLASCCGFAAGDHLARVDADS